MIIYLVNASFALFQVLMLQIQDNELFYILHIINQNTVHLQPFYTIIPAHIGPLQASKLNTKCKLGNRIRFLRTIIRLP